MDPGHFNALASNDQTYWWFYVRHTLVSNLLAAQLSINGHTIPRPAFLLDIGCGTGGFLAHIMRTRFLPREHILGVEPSPQAHRVLVERNIPAVCTSLEKISDRIPSQVDAVSLLDVLEHIADPKAMLEQVKNLTKPGARLIILVPAFSCLWSPWDESLGHYRRYTKEQLCAELVETGWHPYFKRYIFASTFLPALLRSYLMRKHLLSRTEFPAISDGLNSVLRAWYQIESRIPGLPIGTTLAVGSVRLH